MVHSPCATVRSTGRSTEMERHCADPTQPTCLTHSECKQMLHVNDTSGTVAWHILYYLQTARQSDEYRPVPSVKVKLFSDAPMAVNKANIGRYRYAADISVHPYRETCRAYLSLSHSTVCECTLNYGGISLMSAVYKLYSSLHNDRLME